MGIQKQHSTDGPKLRSQLAPLREWDLCKLATVDEAEATLWLKVEGEVQNWAAIHAATESDADIRPKCVIPLIVLYAG